MPDPTKNNEGGNAAESNTADDNKPNGDQPEGDASAGDKTFTQADIDAAVQAALKADRDNAKKKADAGKLSDAEREKQRADEAERELRVMRGESALVKAAVAAKAKNPEKIYRLFKDDLTFGDDGKPTNVAQVIAQARKDFADEFGASGSGDGGAGLQQNNGGKSSMNDLIRQKVNGNG